MEVIVAGPNKPLFRRTDVAVEPVNEVKVIHSPPTLMGLQVALKLAGRVASVILVAFALIPPLRVVVAPVFKLESRVQVEPSVDL